VQSRGLWEGSRLGRADGGLGREEARGRVRVGGGRRPGEGRRSSAGRAGRHALGSAGGQAAARWAAQAGRRPRAGQRGRAGGRVLGCAGGTARRFYDGEDARAALCFFSFFLLWALPFRRPFIKKNWMGRRENWRLSLN